MTDRGIEEGVPLDVNWHKVQWSRLQDFYFSDEESGSSDEEDGPEVTLDTYRTQRGTVRRRWKHKRGEAFCEDATKEFNGSVSKATEFFQRNGGDMRWVKIFSASSREWYKNSPEKPSEFFTILEADSYLTRGDLKQKVLDAIPRGKLDASADLRLLAELEKTWAQITPQEFVMTLKALAPEEAQCEYLQCLAIPVDPELLWKQTKRKYSRGQHSLLMADTVEPWSVSRSGDDCRVQCFPQFAVHQATSTSVVVDTAHVAWCFRRQKPMEYTYRFAYTTAARLFDLDDSEGQVYIVKTLLEHGSGRLHGGGVHGTLIGRAILVNTWINARDGFWRHRCLDIVHLFFLSAVGLKLRFGYGPDMSTVIVLSLFCLRSAYHFVLEMMSNFRYSIFFTSSAVLCLLENVSALGVGLVLWESRHYINKPCVKGSCPIYNSLALFSICILCKWFHFISSMLCLRVFGVKVLPAYYTMISPESTRFLFIICVMIFASMNAYYALPIEDTNQRDASNPYSNLYHQGNASAVWLALQALKKDPGHHTIPNNMLLMALRMFLLNTQGQMDYWDLEGKDPVIQLNLTQLKLAMKQNAGEFNVGTLEDPEPDSDLHQAIVALGIVLVLSVNVILMNVYIGLLSGVYETYSARHWELLAEFRALHALRYMISGPSPIDYVRNCFGFYLGRSCWEKWCPRPLRRRKQREYTGAVWFAYRNDEFEAGINNQEIAFSEIKEILKEVKTLRAESRGRDGLGTPAKDGLPDFFS